MVSPVPVLITRPQPQADRLAADLAQEWGTRVSVLVSPLMAPHFLRPRLPPGPFATLVLSSEAGAQAAAALRQAAGAALPASCACVGERTAAAAQGAGLAVSLTAPTAGALIQALAATMAGPFLYLHGTEVSQPIDRALQDLGHRAHGLAVYDQRAQPLTPAAQQVLRRPGPVVLPLYSARSARLLLAALPADARADLHACAISSTVLGALPPPLHPRTTVSETPDGAGMLSAIRCVLLSLLP